MPPFRPAYLIAALIAILVIGFFMLRSYEPGLTAREMDDCRDERLAELLADRDEPWIPRGEWDSFVDELGDCFR